MKVAIIGSRNLVIKDLEHYLPEGVTEIVSGGAKGIDACAKEYANSNGIKLTEFLPEYERYGRGAPFRRNMQIIDYADEVLAFWDGQSRGTKFVIEHCKAQGKPVQIEDCALAKALRFLLPDQRDMVLLSYFWDYSDRDIAELLHCSADTVRRRSEYAA